jgi:putative flippase GtrA
MVGALCFGVQYVIMVCLATWAGVAWPIANALGFIASAQLNFLLSAAFTWGDRTMTFGWARWLSYHVSVLLGLIANSVAFAITLPVAGQAVASVAGVGTSMVLTYLVGNHVIFRRVGAVSTEGRAR